MKDVLNHRPSIFDPTLAIPIGLVFILFIGIFDATLFDGYVKADNALCWSGNDSPECIAIWENLGCEIGDQGCITKDYHDIQLAVVLLFAGFMFVIRAGMGKMGGSKSNPMLFFVSGMWFFTMIAMFYTGWVDTLYYALRGIPIPDELPWLNDQLLTYAMQWFGSVENFERSELFLLNFLGLVAIAGGWFKIIYIHRKVTGRKRKRK